MMTESSVALHRPRIGTRHAEELLQRIFGIEGTARPLPSERDRNYLITAPEAEYVLKISSSAERRDALEAQNAAMQRLGFRDVPVQRVINTLGTTPIGVAADDEGREHFIRLLTYVPGVPLAKVHPHRPHLIRSLGRFLAEMSRGLAGFDHPGAHRSLVWDLSRAGETVRDRLHLLEDGARRLLVEHFLHHFERQVEPHLDDLRHSVVYNDANEFNVLVDGPENADRSVVSLVDFGDLLYSVTAAEVAVAAAYAMLGSSDPLRTAATLVGAYREGFPLVEGELTALFPLIAMRLCASVCICAEQQQQEPANEYLRVSNAPAWRLLEQLQEVLPRWAEAVFRAACGLEPCRDSAALESWIRSRRFHPVVDRQAEAVTLDFSVESSEFSIEDITEPGRAEPEMARRLGGRTGLGRYGEARLVYASEAFEAGSERRTVHLGVDLFREPGSRVSAPLDGVVHSFADNARAYDYGPTIILEHAPEGAPRFYTLYGHLSRSSLEGLSPGMPIRGGETFASLGTPEENGGWVPHLHCQIVLDMLGREGDFPGVAAPWLWDVWTSISPDPGPMLGLEASVPVREDNLAERRRSVIGPSLSLSYRSPIVLGRGSRHFLYDRDGRQYLDSVNNVAHVGHCHPRVVEAASRAMRVLNTNTRYLYRDLVRYAERLVATLPEPLRVCYFVNSGSEANDLALRLARSFTGRRDAVVLEHAYHGNLSSLVEVSPYKFDGPGGGGRPLHTHVVPIPDPFRGRFRGEGAGAAYVSLVEDIFVRAKRNVAAFLAESVVSCGGQVFLPAGFLDGAYRMAREHGAVCIADEVQTGFGRLGRHFWAFESHGVVPDIVTMGKPIGNGHPIGAVVTTREIAQAFDPGMEYFNTFGGNPVACAAGLAVLDVIREEGLQQRALETGGHFLGRLEEMAERRSIVGDVRGMGLFIGVELVRNRRDRTPAGEETRYVVERMKECGILAGLDGPFHNVLKIKPPLTFDRDAADRFVSTLDSVLGEDFVRARLD